MTSSVEGSGVVAMISFKRSFITPSSMEDTFHFTRFPRIPNICKSD